MHSRTARLRTAWLGLLAMFLLVFAPMVSQALAVARAAPAQAITADLCSAADDMAEASLGHAYHAVMQAQPPLELSLHGKHAHHGDHTGVQDLLDACGYCDFLATHATVPSVPRVDLAPLTVTLIAVLAAPPVRPIALGAYPSGQPRGPPRLPLTV